jgi:sortase A
VCPDGALADRTPVGDRRMYKLRIKSIVSGLLSAALVGAGLALVAFYFLGQNDSTATNSEDPEGFNVPKIEARQESEKGTAEGPEDETLTLTIPKMDRIEDDAVPDATGDDEGALRKHAAIHLEGTGFPWEEEANVYLAGHRLGYPGTDSFLAFWDQNALEKGDEIFVTDSEGAKYTYKVYEEFVTGPTDLSVTKPIPGKDVLTLQTCTLPDYSRRLITRAELVDEA